MPQHFTNILYQELNNYGQVAAKDEFLNFLKTFMTNFRYYTLTAQKLAETTIQNQIEAIEILSEQPD